MTTFGFADKPKTIDALMDNIREDIGEMHTIDNTLKNWTDRAWLAEAAIWMKLFSIINRKDSTFK